MFEHYYGWQKKIEGKKLFLKKLNIFHLSVGV